MVGITARYRNGNRPQLVLTVDSALPEIYPDPLASTIGARVTT